MMPENIPLPVIDPAKEMAKEEEADLALLGIEKQDGSLQDKVKAPPPVSPAKTSEKNESEPAKATASAEALGSIFYGAKKGKQIQYNQALSAVQKQHFAETLSFA